MSVDYARFWQLGVAGVQTFHRRDWEEEEEGETGTCQSLFSLLDHNFSALKSHILTHNRTMMFI